MYPGDRIGVAALSGVVDPESLEAGVEALFGLGYEPVLAANLTSRHGLFAGSDEERVAGFHELAADVTLGAIMFARGGHGTLRVLPHLDWTLLERRPRAYVGYSDLTPLLNLVVSRLGVVALHGPMVAADLARGLTPQETESLVGGLRGEFAASQSIAGCGKPVVGRLVGGCLSLLAAATGTDYAVTGKGAILFWEDVEEPVYRLDRMLTQLRLSGSLIGIRGMVVGRLDPQREDGEEKVLEALLQDWGRELSCSIGYGVESGHCRPNMTLPLGLNARMEPDRGMLSFGTAR